MRKRAIRRQTARLAKAQLALGMAREYADDFTGAAAIYRRVARGGTDGESAAAAALLGRLLLERMHDLKGAESAYVQAWGGTYLQLCLVGAEGAGRVREATGDLQGAEAAYQWVVDNAPRVGLGAWGTTHQIGDQSSQEAGSLAADGPHEKGALALPLNELLDLMAQDLAQGTVLVRIRLAQIQERLGKTDEGIQNLAPLMADASTEAQGIRDPRILAANTLASLYETTGDNDRRETALRFVADRGPDMLAAHALTRLGVLEEIRGRIGVARKNYEDALARTNGDYPAATFKLAVLQQRAGELDAACQGYRHVLRAHDPELASAAAWFLGSTLLILRDKEGAREAFRIAQQSHSPTWSAKAREALSRLD